MRNYKLPANVHKARANFKDTDGLSVKAPAPVVKHEYVREGWLRLPGGGRKRSGGSPS